LISCGLANAGDQDFTLINKTGVEINELFISPADLDHWGEDVLSVDTLPDGLQADIHFSPAEQADFWDLKVVNKAGDSIEWNHLKLTQISQVTLTFKNGQPLANCQ
jgi:hypothetical protein